MVSALKTALPEKKDFFFYFPMLENQLSTQFKFGFGVNSKMGCCVFSSKTRKWGIFFSLISKSSELLISSCPFLEHYRLSGPLFYFILFNIYLFIYFCF